MNRQDFKLNELEVDPDDLLLDPGNPRIQNAVNQTEYSDSEIASREVQDRILRQLQEKQYGVQKLIDSIRTNGFVNIDSIFVKRTTIPGKFLVLEGNRRTTATKLVRQRSEKLDPEVARSLKRIPVKELVCDDSQIRQDMTAFILAIRHLGGVKEWAPMQQAYQIYAQYMKALTGNNASGEFRKDAGIVQRLSGTLNREKKDIWNALRIVVAFNQLKGKDYLVSSDHYTVLDIAVNKYPSLATKFFEVSQTTFTMSYKGLERFSRLCLDEGHKIKNPGDFRAFFHIFRDGTENECTAALESDLPLTQIKDFLNTRPESIVNELKLIKEKIGGLKIANFARTKEERELIGEIKQLIDEKLCALATE